MQPVWLSQSCWFGSHVVPDGASHVWWECKEKIHWDKRKPCAKGTATAWHQKLYRGALSKPGTISSVKAGAQKSHTHILVARISWGASQHPSSHLCISPHVSHRMGSTSGDACLFKAAPTPRSHFPGCWYVACSTTKGSHCKKQSCDFCSEVNSLLYFPCHLAAVHTRLYPQLKAESTVLHISPSVGEYLHTQAFRNQGHSRAGSTPGQFLDLKNLMWLLSIWNAVWELGWRMQGRSLKWVVHG